MSAKPFAVCAALAFALVPLAPALAEEPVMEPAAYSDATMDDVSIRVPISDLNIDRRSGAQIALVRMHDAARQICGDARADLLRLSMTAQRQACAKRAVDMAVATLDSPIVTALNAEQEVQTTMLASRK